VTIALAQQVAHEVDDRGVAGAVRLHEHACRLEDRETVVVLEEDVQAQERSSGRERAGRGDPELRRWVRP
jgi:hypothetical protein